MVAIYMFSTLAKPIMISKHMYEVALTPYLPYEALDAKVLLLYTSLDSPKLSFSVLFSTSSY